MAALLNVPPLMERLASPIVNAELVLLRSTYVPRDICAPSNVPPVIVILVEPIFPVRAAVAVPLM